MKIHSLGDGKPTGYATWGCLWERGRCRKETDYLVRGENGVCPSQVRMGAYWPDGSVKWTFHTADAGELGREAEVSPIGPGEEAAPDGSRRLKLKESEEEIVLKGLYLTVHVPKDGRRIFSKICYEGKVCLKEGEAVLQTEEPFFDKNRKGVFFRNYTGRIQEVSVEETGPLYTGLCFRGIHVDEEENALCPFIIRMKLGFSSRRVDFTHTFLYDGDEHRDFLKGIGFRCYMPLSGALYNRHIKCMGDFGMFHEASAQLLTWRPRIPEAIYKAQMGGEPLFPVGEDKEKIDTVMACMPFWSEYRFFQDRVNHFSIKKKLGEEDCCFLSCLEGIRSEGGAALGSENGSVAFSIRDFWERYPSGYSFEGMDKDSAAATIWLYSPDAPAMDFRHYAKRGYNQTCYEGYDYFGATPYGIGCTSEFSMGFFGEILPSDEALKDFTHSVKYPTRYVADPAFYHGLRAFGPWSLPKKGTEMERWLEEQLEKAFLFFKKEVEQRNWYGMFDYGDFCHSYDKERHSWRYDMGGYAWDNTELVPTLWLWYYFLRTGREDVFLLAERLSRHTSEVDVYHIGKYKGLGSRHNVSHWGCPCKEARIAMAAHHRVFYYLTGDRRLEEIFEEWKDNEMTFLEKDPLGDFYDKRKMVYPAHARTGPDWSSLCSNWMTRWERQKDSYYRDKILRGIEDIKKAPLQLVSGPDFEFDPATVRLRYIGERASGGTHLQICMGAPQVWMELALLLANEQWERMLADYGRFYFLPRQQQLEESKGIIGEREFSLPFMAAAMGAYGASYFSDERLAGRVWQILLQSLISESSQEGFSPTVQPLSGNHEKLSEIPWISTNFAAQWCLNIIVCLEFIGKSLPGTMKEAKALVAADKAAGEAGFRKA